MTMMRRKSLKGVSFVILLAFLLAGCGNNGVRSGKNVPIAYPVLRLAEQDVTVHDEYPATLEGTQDVAIRPKIDGYIDKIYVKEGALVKKGQLLFHIRNQEYVNDVATAKAAVLSAQAEVNSAKLEVEKVRPLVESNIVSHYELETDELTLKIQKAALEESKAELATAETNQGYLSIYSPNDGVIGTIPYRIGSLVSSSNDEALTTLSAGLFVNAYFVLTEQELIILNKTKKGKSLQEKIAQLPKAELVLSDGSLYAEKGSLELASGMVETATGSVSLKAIFPNPDGILQSGASVDVMLPHNYIRVILIPQSSSYEVLNKHLVVVVGDDNKTSIRGVTVIPTDGGKYYIVTKGLNPGDQIVLQGITKIKDGTLITPTLKTGDEIQSSNQ